MSSEFWFLTKKNLCIFCFYYPKYEIFFAKLLGKSKIIFSVTHNIDNLVNRMYFSIKDRN